LTPLNDAAFVKRGTLYHADLLLSPPWLEHGFGTRAPCPWDHDPATATLRQVHSDTCVYADGREGCLGEGDALVTDRVGCLLVVRTADCLPILIADERRKAVAAVHAGWRGTLLGIAAQAVLAMQDRFGSRPADLLVAIGPAIGPCCYEVGEEVAPQFQNLFPERSDLAGRAHIDLREATRRQLEQAGVRGERITIARLCTRCNPEEFHSWRRDGRVAGRMRSGIRILDAAKRALQEKA
jgi:YfiH family protein